MRRALHQGYTLIEVLVVLFIISIVTTVALLSISHNDNKQIEAFAKDLTQMMSLAEEQAMLNPDVLGLSFKDHALSFLKQSKDGWSSLDDPIFEKYTIPSNIEVTVAQTTSNPQIVISTNGNVTPFTIYIGKKGQKPRYVIRGDADGSVTNNFIS